MDGREARKLREIHEAQSKTAADYSHKLWATPVPKPDPNKIVPGCKPLCMAGWPIVYKCGYFREGDVVRDIHSGKLGTVVNTHPSSTYPGDISVDTAGYTNPDGWYLVWRDEPEGEL